MAAILLSSFEEIGKLRMGEGPEELRCFFGKKFPSEKGNVRTARLLDAKAISFDAKVRGEVFAHFHTVAEKRHSSMCN
jgi:hypothetical protein